MNEELEQSRAIARRNFMTLCVGATIVLIALILAVVALYPE
jgi:hypothetical protein